MHENVAHAVLAGLALCHPRACLLPGVFTGMRKTSPFILGDIFVPPLLFPILCVALVLALWVTVWVRFLLRPRSQRGRWQRLVPTVVSVVVALPLVLFVALMSLLLTPSTFVPVTPLGPAGCQVVVEVDAPFKVIRGDIFLKRPGQLQLQRTGASWADDMRLSPFKDGHWSLSWEGSRANLMIFSEDRTRDLVHRGELIDCGR